MQIWVLSLFSLHETGLACWDCDCRCPGAAPVVQRFRKHQHIHARSIRTVASHSRSSCWLPNDAWFRAYQDDHKTLEIPWSGALLHPGAWYRFRHMESASRYRYHNISKLSDVRNDFSRIRLASRYHTTDMPTQPSFSIPVTLFLSITQLQELHGPINYKQTWALIKLCEDILLSTDWWRPRFSWYRKTSYPVAP